MADYPHEAELVNLAAKAASTHNYVYKSDVRAAVFGGQGRVSTITEYLKDQNNSTNRYHHDNWEQYLRSKSVTDAKPLSQGKRVFHKTSTYD